MGIPLSKELAVEAAKALEAAGGNLTVAAESLGLSRSTFQNRLRVAVQQGMTQKPRTVLAATSTLYDEKGNVKLQWVKEDATKQTQKAAQEAFLASIRDEVTGLAKAVPKPSGDHENMLSAVVIGDAHFGMRAFGAETGDADFDLKIAERELKAAVSYLVQTSPKSKYGMLVDVGDFMHVDNRKQATPNGGNLLDVDTRYQNLCRVVIMTLRHCIKEMLKKYEHVFVVCRPGNHNQDSAGWMSLALSMFYESEPRVTVDTSQAEYYYHRFGKTLIGIAHGDKCKFADLIPIMATDRPKDWGETEHRYFWTGHVHHTKQLEFRGGFAESFNTLAPGDAWHAASGYRSKRQMQRIDVHAEHGILGRGFCYVGMLDLDESARISGPKQRVNAARP